MNYYSSYDKIIKQVLDGVIIPQNLDNNILDTEFGVKIIELKRNRFDRRNTFVNDDTKWYFGDEDLSWNVNLGDGYSSHQIDITTNGKYLCYRKTFVDYIFYEIHILTKQEVDLLKERLQFEKIEKDKRLDVVDKLTSVLINQMYPYSKLFSGELETKYGIHLKEIQRAEHRFMKYVPNTSNQHWVVNAVLCWGSNTGWDVMRDGKIACCRVNYDDYINFEIQILDHEQIEDYKIKFANPDDKLMNRLSTLKKMVDQNLISIDEFTEKKREILQNI